MEHLKEFKIFESVQESLFLLMNRNEWRQKRISKGYDSFTKSDLKEIDDILNFRNINYNSWQQLYCEYIIEIDGSRYRVGSRLTKITINKCQDEWFYIEISDLRSPSLSRSGQSLYYFEVDSMDGLENLLNTIISFYKNNSKFDEIS